MGARIQHSNTRLGTAFGLGAAHFAGIVTV